MTQDRIWELLAKKLAGEASAHELEELEDKLRQSPDLHYPMQTISDLWFQNPPVSEDAFTAYDKHLARMKERGILQDPASTDLPEDLFPPRRKFPRNMVLGLLAFVLLGVGAYTWYPAAVEPTHIPDQASTTLNEVSTLNGSQSKVMLPDGSQVWLNSGSKITYAKDFGAAIREVNLVGEAFFDVVKNPAKPFVIHARNVNIRVVGTAFNVKSYPGDKTTETSLIRGIIEVNITNRPAEKIILKPNEKLVVAADEKPLENAAKPQMVSLKKTPQVVRDSISYLAVDSTVIETSWMEHKLIFNDESFYDLARRMERWYGVTIRFSDNRLEKLRLTGNLEQETLQQALKALKITAPFNYKIEKGEVIITP